MEYRAITEEQDREYAQARELLPAVAVARLWSVCRDEVPECPIAERDRALAEEMERRYQARLAAGVV